jgi:hypothetical protein
MYSAAVTETMGLQPIRRDVLEDMIRPQSADKPLWWPGDVYPAWATGFTVPKGDDEMLSLRSFGHGGMGGQLAFGDLKYRAGVGFASSELVGWGDERLVKPLGLLRAKLAAEV